MREFFVAILMLVGAGFILLAAVGILRMPDLYTRMQPATKATTLGVGFMLAGVALHFGEVGVTARAFAGIVFLILTAPIAAHMIGRAAYVLGVPLWQGTKIDELSGRYDPVTHELASSGPTPEAGDAAPRV